MAVGLHRLFNKEPHEKQANEETRKFYLDAAIGAYDRETARMRPRWGAMIAAATALAGITSSGFAITADSWWGGIILGVIGVFLGFSGTYPAILRTSERFPLWLWLPELALTTVSAVASVLRWFGPVAAGLVVWPAAAAFALGGVTLPRVGREIAFRRVSDLTRSNAAADE